MPGTAGANKKIISLAKKWTYSSTQTAALHECEIVVTVHSKACLTGLKIRLKQSHNSIIPKYKQLTWILCSSVLEVGSISFFKWKHSKLLYLKDCHLLQAELKQIMPYLNDFR